MADDVLQLIPKMLQEIREDMKEIRTDIKGIHARIDKVESQLGHLAGGMVSLRKEMRDMNQSIEIGLIAVHQHKVRITRVKDHLNLPFQE